MNRQNNPLVRLATSSKAIVVLAVTIATFIAFFAGRVAWHDAAEFLKWLLAPWLLAQGAEDAARNLAAGRSGQGGGGVGGQTLLLGKTELERIRAESREASAALTADPPAS